jgi:hypothetical protein
MVTLRGPLGVRLERLRGSPTLANLDASRIWWWC